ncbi:hypothetical protein [Streptomyces sp. H27-H1]|uniref:hypothetical protein n=1 Tax=Streptomyces sp. H27-H1 TaxID=2996461 RepID=UPI002D1E3C29|nr:hypothetical protein [Streptomyces sp. H27-H1]
MCDEKRPQNRTSLLKVAHDRAITEPGYVPNHAARALAGSRTGAVALVIADSERRFFAKPVSSGIVRAVGSELADHDMQLLLTRWCGTTGKDCASRSTRGRSGRSRAGLRA